MCLVVRKLIFCVWPQYDTFGYVFAPVMTLCHTCIMKLLSKLLLLVSSTKCIKYTVTSNETSRSSWMVKAQAFLGRSDHDWLWGISVWRCKGKPNAINSVSSIPEEISNSCICSVRSSLHQIVHSMREHVICFVIPRCCDIDVSYHRESARKHA
jgi:hypothetical protein